MVPEYEVFLEQKPKICDTDFGTGEWAEAWYSLRTLFSNFWRTVKKWLLLARWKRVWVMYGRTISNAIPWVSIQQTCDFAKEISWQNVESDNWLLLVLIITIEERCELKRELSNILVEFSGNRVHNSLSS